MPPRRRYRSTIAAALLVCGALSTLGVAKAPQTAIGAGVGRRPAPGRRRDWGPHIAAARRYARSRAGEVAFALIDESGRMHRFHARRTAPAASVFKVMLLAAFLRMRRDSGLSRHDRDLLGPMIRRSDSVAATEVRDLVGVRRIERVARVSGMRDFRYRAIWGESRTSPRDQARFMYRLERYIPGRHRPYALHLLSHIVRSQRWGIGRVAPRGWRLFFKGGWGSGSGRVDHQVALLLRGGRRVSLAIFTQFDPSHAYGERTERGIAARLLAGLGDSNPARSGSTRAWPNR